MTGLYQRPRLAIWLTVSLVALAAMAEGGAVPYPQPGTGVPISDGMTLVANGGDVTITFQANTATYNDYLFLYSPTPSPAFSPPPVPGNYLFWNHDPALTPGVSTVSLGPFAAGTELIFGEYVANTSETFFSGLGSRNPDGDVHAYVTADGANTVFVGFEDLAASAPSDFNYNDITFTMQNLSVVSVPEPGTVGLMLGAGMLVGIRSRVAPNAFTTYPQIRRPPNRGGRSL